MTRCKKMRLRLPTEEQSPETELPPTVFQKTKGKEAQSGLLRCVCVCVCVCTSCPCRLETGGVDGGDGVELGDAAVAVRVKAFRLAAHLKEHFLFLQLPGKLLLQGLLPGS